MTTYQKLQVYIDVQKNLSTSEVDNATDLKAWMNDWDEWVTDESAPVGDRPPVKPPHP